MTYQVIMIKINSIQAATLQSIVKEAPLEECQKALERMPYNQALQYLRKKYSKESVREQNIEFLKEHFPSATRVSIINALDQSNNDIDSALMLLLEEPQSFEEKNKSGDIPNNLNSVKMKKRNSSSNSNSKKVVATPTNTDEKKQSSSNVPLKIPSNGPQSYIIEKPKSWARSRDPIFSSSLQKKSGSSILPRMEIPSSKIESDWNKSPFIFSNYHSLKNLPVQENNQNSDDYDDDVKVYSDNNDDQYDDSEEFYEEEEEEEILDDYDNDSQPGTTWKTERIDLHGYSKQEARFIVEKSISSAKKNRIGVFHFVTGVGHGSLNHIPVLRPLVLEICQKYNVYAFLPEKNKGVVVCDIRKPYEEIDDE